MPKQNTTTNQPPQLIVFSGLPGVGKSSIARELAREIEAVYLRIDSIEQALRDSEAHLHPMNDAGYCVAYALAADNLRLGRTVVADCVNPIATTRDSWRQTAAGVGVGVQEIEVRCSDQAEHRRRVEARGPDMPGVILPTWEEVLGREYQPWNRDRIEVDTATLTTAQILSAIRRMLGT